MKRDPQYLMELVSRIEGGEQVFQPIDTEAAGMLGFVPEQKMTRTQAESLDYHLRLLEKDGLIEARRLSGGVIVVDGLTTMGHDWLDRKKMDRDKLLMRLLLSKLKGIMSHGVTYHFRGNDQELEIEGYSTSQISNHLQMLLDHGFVKPSGSQPADGGVIISGLTPSGYDFIDQESNGTEHSNAAAKKSSSKEIFIVHGHDSEARETIARFVEKLGLKAVILHERPNKGRTIITKFREEAANVGFALVLMTPDDQGGPSRGSMQSRARQNVVFELGFFIGALGPERVVALVKGQVERPSDFDGVVYISMDATDWRTQLGREMDAAGFKIDWNVVMRA